MVQNATQKDKKMFGNYLYIHESLSKFEMVDLCPEELKCRY